MSIPDGTTADVIDAAELAKRLDLHVATVRRMAAGNQIPGHKLGTVWRFYWPVVCDLLSNGAPNHQAKT